jgi:L-lactate transport
MWQQPNEPIGGSLVFSALVAAVPVFVLLYLLGIRRTPAWKSALAGLGAALLVAVAAYRMPLRLTAGAVSYGAAFGLFPIGWIVFWSVFLYRLTVATGKFEIIKDSIGSLTSDRRLQALLIAFAFGAFVEGAAGFGAPVAVAAAMLAGLGFSPFYAAGICLLANTAPVAFGSIGIPVITLAGITGLDLRSLSAAVGKICAPVSLMIPSYLILVMGGWKAWRGVAPAALACGLSFASAQFLASRFLGPEMTDLVSSLTAIGVVVAILAIWRPKDRFELEGNHVTEVSHVRHGGAQTLLAWMPYVLLVVFVVTWGLEGVRKILNSYTLPIPWPGLHNLVERTAPVVAQPAPYEAVFRFNWLSAAGTSCMLAGFVSLAVLRVPLRQAWRVLVETWRQLFLSLVTIASVLALAFLMNYCGATGTLGLAFAASGVMFPFFSALLGWLGVFLTGSDTSANALFGNLQVVTASRLGLSPVLMAASNSAGGVMGKMISLQSIAVAAAATGMPSSEESRLFRFTLKHSIFLASVVGLVVVLYAYVL